MDGESHVAEHLTGPRSRVAGGGLETGGESLGERKDVQMTVVTRRGEK